MLAFLGQYHDVTVADDEDFDHTLSSLQKPAQQALPSLRLHLNDR